MKKIEFTLISIIIIGSVGFTLLGDPLENLLPKFWDNGADNNSLIAGIIVRLILISVLLFITRKIGSNNFIGFRKGTSLRNRSLLILPFILVVFGILLNWEIYVEANNFHITLIIISVLCYGIVEELCFRGLVLPLSVNAFKEKTNFLYLGIIISSILFGLVHYTNYLDVHDFWGVTSQVIYASAMGVLLGAFMLRTGNIFVPALIHAVLNFLFGHGLIDNQNSDENLNLVSSSSNLEWLSIIFTISMFLVILGIGLNMIKLVDREAILKDLKSIKV